MLTVCVWILYTAACFHRSSSSPLLCHPGRNNIIIYVAHADWFSVTCIQMTEQTSP